MIHTANHHRISVGRCTHTITLENPVMMANIKNNIHSRIYVLSLFLIHRIKSPNQNHIDIAAWSDGNELFGKNLCSKVSSSALPNSNTDGLDFVKKNWIHTFIADVIIADQNIHNADSLILSLFLISPTMYIIINNTGNKNTKTSAVIGIKVNKTSWNFMYSFSVVIRLIHRNGSCNAKGNIIFLLIIKILYICKFE